MNARFLERLIAYRGNHRLSFCKEIISQKIEHQFAVVGHRDESKKYEKDIINVTDIEGILLIEARAARQYWSLFGKDITKGSKIGWYGRKAHNEDTANQLLDIGYHYLAQRVSKIFHTLEVPTELGFFHKAQGKTSAPLVYDFMEWLRPFVVDEVLIKMVHKKKKTINLVDKKIISHLIFKIKKKFDQKYYHQKLNYCITLDYWVKLLILEFMGAVNSNKAYKPVFPSLRHESRCKKCKIKPLEQMPETV